MGAALQMRDTRVLWDTWPRLQNVYRRGDTALLRLGIGLFVRLPWDWTQSSRLCTTAAGSDVIAGIDALVDATPERIELLPIVYLRAWAERKLSMYPDRQRCFGRVFDRHLVADGLRAFEGDEPVFVAVFPYNEGYCLRIQRGLFAAFCMSMACGEPGDDPMPESRI